MKNATDIKISGAELNYGWDEIKNKFEKDDLMELVTPSGNVTFELHELVNKDGNQTDVAPGSGHVVRIPIPDEVQPGALDEFAMLVRYLPRQ